MSYTCDECKLCSLGSGICRKTKEPRHSYGEDACELFELADDLKSAPNPTPAEVAEAKARISMSFLTAKRLIPSKLADGTTEYRFVDEKVYEDIRIILAALEAAEKENKRLLDENVQDFRMDELDAVMHSVDKWLEGKQLENNPATRAADAREAALKIIDNLTARATRAEAMVKELRYELSQARCYIAEPDRYDDSIEYRLERIDIAIAKSEKL